MNDTQYSERELAVFRSFSRRIDPSDAGAHNNLGVFYYRKGLVADAIREFERALELDPKMQVAERNLDTAHRETGYYDIKVSELRNRLRSRPDDREVRSELARIFVRLGQIDDAVAELRAILAKHPDDVAAVVQLGMAERSRGDLDAAAEWFAKAVELDPSSSVVQFHLGETLFHRGMGPEAAAALNRAVELNPDNADAHYLLAFVLGEQGRHEQARAAAKMAIQLNPSLGKAHASLSLEKESARRETAERASQPDVTAQQTERNPHLKLGNAFRQKGMYAEALREYRRGMEAGEDRERLMRALAETLLLRGDYEAAVEAYEIVLADFAPTAKAATEYGVSLHQLGRHPDAEAAYRSALQMDPAYGFARNNLGVAAAQKGDLASAAREFETASDTAVVSVIPALNRGLLLRQKGRHQQAIDSYRRALAIDPGCAAAWNGIGQVLTELGKISDARNAYIRAVESDPDSAESHYNLSFALSSLGEFDDALRAVNRAQELDPYYTPQKFRLAAELLQARGDDLAVIADVVVAAERVAEQFDVEEGVVDRIFEELQRPPERKSAEGATDDRLRLARDYLDKGLLEMASAEVNRALARGADQAAAYALAGRIFAARGLHGEALERFRAARRHDGDDLELRLGEIRALLSVGESQQALEEARDLSSENPDNPAVAMQLASAMADTGDPAGALIELERARQRAPQSADLLRLAGDIAAEMGDFERARRAYHDALGLDSRLLQVRVALGDIYREREDWDAAESAYREALDVLPTYGDAALALAQLYRSRAQARQAVNLLVDLLANNPSDLEALLSLGQALLEDNRPEEALQAFRRILARDARNVASHYHCGVVLARLKRYREAMAEWSEVIRLDPSGPYAKTARNHTRTATDLIRIFDTEAA